MIYAAFCLYLLTWLDWQVKLIALEAIPKQLDKDIYKYYRPHHSCMYV